MTAHTNPSSSRDPGSVNSAPGAAGPIFTAKDGKVFYRGFYQSPDDCSRTLDHLRASRTDQPWERALNERLIRELEDAMTKAFHMEIAA